MCLNDTIHLVKQATLAMQRYSWEQGALWRRHFWRRATAKQRYSWLWKARTGK